MHHSTSHTQKKTENYKDFVFFSTDGVKFISWLDFLPATLHEMSEEEEEKDVPMDFRLHISGAPDETKIGVNKKKVLVCKRR